MSIKGKGLQSLTLYKPDKTYNGFTLFTPFLVSPANTWLIDIQGRFVHQWKWPGQVSQQAVLLPSGNLFGGIRIPKGPLARWTWGGGEMIDMDWNGNIIWRYKEPYANMHDRIRRENGNTLFAKFVPTPKDIAPKVKGGTPVEEVLWCDNVQEVTPDGKVVWE